MTDETNPWNDRRSSSVDGRPRTEAGHRDLPPVPVPAETASSAPAPDAEPIGAPKEAAAAPDDATLLNSLGSQPAAASEPEAAALPPVAAPAPAAAQASANYNLTVTSVILGALSILFSAVPLVGLILAIAAIACAVRSTRGTPPTGLSTAGKVLGIAGAIISALVNLLLIVSIWLAAGALGETYTTLETNTVGSHLDNVDDGPNAVEQDERELHDLIKPTFDALEPTDPELKTQVKQYLASMVLDDFGDDIDSFGVDPEAYANWMLVDLSFRTSDMLTRDSAGTCYVYVTHRDPIAFVIAWAKALDKAADDPAYQHLPQEQAAALMQEIFYTCLAECTATTETRASFEFESTDGVWSLDEESWDEAYPKIFFPEE